MRSEAGLGLAQEMDKRITETNPEVPKVDFFKSNMSALRGVMAGLGLLVAADTGVAEARHRHAPTHNQLNVKGQSEAGVKDTPKAINTEIAKPSFSLAVDSSLQPGESTSQWGVEPTWFYKDGEGKQVFNLWSLLTPFQVFESWQTPHRVAARFDIVYNYSKDFGTGEPSDPNSFSNASKEMQRTLQEKIKNELAGVLRGFEWGKKVHVARNTNTLKGVKVTGLTVQGFSSAESTVSGPSSFLPGKINEENIGLAKLRAESAAPSVRQALKEVGLPNDDVPLNELPAQEVQFTKEELTRLAALSLENYPNTVSGDDNSRIFRLLVDYNQGHLSGAAKEELDKIVGSKRKVSIQISMEGKKPETIVVPIPWLILLPLLFPFLRRRKEKREKNSFGFFVEKEMTPGSYIVIVDRSSSMEGRRTMLAENYFSKLVGEVNGKKIGLGWMVFGDKVHHTSGGKVKEKNKKVSFEEIMEEFKAAPQVMGGTNFKNPLQSALEWIKDSKIKKPKIIFITDGESDLDNQFIDQFLQTKKDLGFQTLLAWCDLPNSQASITRVFDNQVDLTGNYEEVLRQERAQREKAREQDEKEREARRQKDERERLEIRERDQQERAKIREEERTRLRKNKK